MSILREIDYAKALKPYPQLHELHRVGMEHYSNTDVPNCEELGEIWQAKYSDEKIIRLLGNNMLGVMTEPATEEEPLVLVSVDLDEIVRTTCRDLLSYGGKNINDCYGVNPYDSPFGFETGTLSPAVVGLIVKELVNADQNIEKIQRILSSIRPLGGYVVANTSSLETTEEKTVEFLSNYLPDCFDGILFPRNFDGNGIHNKGMLKMAVYQELHTLERNQNIDLVFAIDDSQHHISDIEEAVEKNGGINFIGIVPKYNHNFPPPLDMQGSNFVHVDTPLEGFELIETRFHEHIEGKAA